MTIMAIITTRGGSGFEPLQVKLESLLMEACVVLRAAAALDLGAKEYPPCHDRHTNEGNGESDDLPTAQTKEGFRGAALLGWRSGREALRRRRRRRRRRRWRLIRRRR